LALYPPVTIDSGRSERPRVWIEELTFNDGTKVSLKLGDVIVLVSEIANRKSKIANFLPRSDPSPMPREGLIPSLASCVL